MARRRPASRRSRSCFTAGLENLERRDCPAIVSISGPSEVEEKGSAITLVATLSEPQLTPVEVRYFTAGAARAGLDYQLAVVQSNQRSPLRTPSGTFVFRPGQTSVSIRLTPLNDTVREGDEAFQFNLLSARGHTLGTKSVAGSILDDDSYKARIVGPARVAAGEAAEYQVQLYDSDPEVPSPATKRETFYVSTAAVTASSLPTADDPTPDYFPLTKVPLVFQPGETSKTFRVQTVASAANERDQFFVIQTTSASADFGRIDPFGVTIVGTGPGPAPTISVADVSRNEGNSGKTQFTFTVSLSAPSAAPVRLSYATRDGSATVADNDYEAVTGSVTIAPGSTSATIGINVIGDLRQEPDETFQLVLSDASQGWTILNPTVTATIRNDDSPAPTSAFTIDVVFPDASLSPSQQLMFSQAAARWSQIIVGDLPDVTVDGVTIDDIRLTAVGRSIDGTYGTLGTGGPSWMVGDPRPPSEGELTFDTADLAWMEANGTLLPVILHEMGHALGLGTMWAYRGLLGGGGYTGIKALQEYRTLFNLPNATSIPTAGSGHWSESVFKTELMTPIAEQPGTPMPISRMTIGSLEDLGYTVNYAAADVYVRPAAIQSAGRSYQMADSVVLAAYAQASQAVGFLPKPARRNV